MIDVHSKKEAFYSMRVGAGGRVHIQPPGTGELGSPTRPDPRVVLDG